MTRAKASEHWQRVYETKDAARVSWYRNHLDTSLQLLDRAGLSATSRVIDVGAGASTLIDDLLARGIQGVTALDISEASLAIVRARLGSQATRVNWIIADVTKVRLPPSSIDIWHDRATLHFLIEQADVLAYVDVASVAIATGGYAVIGGFAPDGPTHYSGLPVARRAPSDIAQLFSSRFKLVESRNEVHMTPAGSAQSFVFALLQKQR